MKTKVIFFTPLMNMSGDSGEPYRVMNVATDILYNGKDEQLKGLLRERIDGMFNNDVDGYFAGLNVTEEDIEKCISDLASHEDGSIGHEFFWWGDVDGLIVADN